MKVRRGMARVGARRVGVVVVSMAMLGVWFSAGTADISSASGPTVRLNVAGSPIRPGPTFMSGNGRYIGYSSTQVAGGLYDRTTETSSQVAVRDSDDEVAPAGSAYAPVVTNDGRYAALLSTVDLVDGSGGFTHEPSNGALFLRDRQLGTTERLTIRSNGTPIDLSITEFGISADARYSVWGSADDSIVPSDSNDTYDVFVHDRIAGTTELVSVAGNGASGNAYSLNASISNDGRYVAFVSGATNLTPDSSAGVLVRDRLAGTTRSVYPAVVDDIVKISGDGRYVFVSTNGSPPNGEGAVRVTVATGAVEDVAVLTNGLPITRASVADASSDGRFVTILQRVGTGPITVKAFVRDLDSGITQQVDLLPNGAAAPNFTRIAVDVSDDGSVIAFTSAEILFNNNSHALFVRDMTYDAPGAAAHATLPALGGTVSTGVVASPASPVETQVTAPGAGLVRIVAVPTTSTAPSGYTLAGSQVVIGAPPATVNAPLRLAFRVDSSTLTALHTTAAGVVVFRDGVPIQSCTTPSVVRAAPDPCVYSRTTLGDGDAQIGVYTSHASTWNLGVKIATAPTGFRITTASLAAGAVGKAYRQTVVATGGTAPYKFKKVGKLPKGLKLAAKTGVISGKPKAKGTSSFSITVTDSKKKPKRTTTKAFTIRIS